MYYNLLYLTRALTLGILFSTLVRVAVVAKLVILGILFMISFILELRVVLHCTENHIFFFQTYWKDGISKKIALELDFSCIIEKDYISFFRKYDLTPRRKMKDDLSQKKNTRKYDI